MKYFLHSWFLINIRASNTLSVELGLWDFPW